MIWLGTYGLTVINMPTKNEAASSSVETRMINVTMAATASCVMGLVVHHCGLAEKLKRICTKCGGKRLETEEERQKEDKKKGDLLNQTKSKNLMMGMYTALISIAGSCATAEPEVRLLLAALPFY